MESLYFIEGHEPNPFSRHLSEQIGEKDGLTVLPNFNERDRTRFMLDERRSHIEDATICILALDDKTLDSKVTYSELRWATEQGKPVIVLAPNAEQPERDDWLLRRYDLPMVQGNSEFLVNYLKGLRKEFRYTADDSLIIKPDFQIAVAKLSDSIAIDLQRNPNAIRDLTPRQFEELIAELMEKNGYDVTLTKESRDDGVDIFAVKSDSFGRFLTVVDCKRYREDRKIGIEIVRGMFGTLKIHDASHAMIATTSSFSSVCTKFEAEHEYILSLKDHSDIVNWAKT